MQNIFIDILPPWVETGLQPAFYDLESGTVLQQTARMYAKVRELTEAYNTFTQNIINEVTTFEQNTNDEIERFEGDINDTVEEYINKFNELHDYVEDYFDNLDVQEEINNKLDDMAEQGVLADIISQYLNSIAVFGYDNVASMKSATNLIDGSYARTMGYYTKNDGGASTYRIRPITNDDVVDEASIIEIGEPSNHLIAELIYSDSISLEQFGCYGDNVHDDTSNFQKAVTYAESKKLLLKSRGDKTYKVTSPITVNTLICNLNDATITTPNHINIFYINSTDFYGDIEHITFDCTTADAGIYINNGRKKTFKNLIFVNISTYGFYYRAGYEILLADSHFYGNNQKNTYALYLTSSDSKFENLIMIDCHTAIYNSGLNYFDFIHAWIYTTAIVEDSIFANLAGNRAYFDQCYSDTYGITFNCNGGSFVANQLEVFLNDGIWTSDLGQPYVAYFPTSADRNSFNQISNSRLNGVRSSQHLFLSNESVSMIQLNNNNRVWVDNYVGIVGELTGLSSNVTTVHTNKLTWNNGIVTLDFVATVTVNPNDTRSFQSAILPIYFQPEVPIDDVCINAPARWQTGENSYLYIDTNVQATLSYKEGATTRVVKIHKVWKSKQYANI